MIKKTFKSDFILIFVFIKRNRRIKKGEIIFNLQNILQTFTKIKILLYDLSWQYNN